MTRFKARERASISNDRVWKAVVEDSFREVGEIDRNLDQLVLSL